MASYFEIDDVIDPADSRRWIATLFDEPTAPLVGAPGQAPAATSTPGSQRPLSQSQRSQAPRSSTSWLSTLTPSRSDRLVDRPLEPRIVERDQSPALIAHQVVMVLAARVEAGSNRAWPSPTTTRSARPCSTSRSSTR